MKIHGNGGGKIQGTDRSKKAKPAASSKSGVASASSSDSDRIELSDQNESLSLIRQMVADVPDIRLEEVERVMKKLKDGKYSIDYEKVADSFIKEALMTEVARKMMKKRDA
jgi:flagellar biosynthesis anti-sigma factor FlgM